MAALLVGIALIVYIATLDSRSDGTGAGDAVGPVGDDVVPAENETDTSGDGFKSQGVVSPVKSEADRFGSDMSSEPDLDDAPSLAPTPEGAIIGRSDTSGSTKAGKKGVRKKGLEADSSRAMKEETEGQTETQAEQESGERKEGVPEKGEDTKKDLPDKKTATDKQVGPEKKTPSKKTSPKKLDDNPF
jgi:hypothetical protein